MFASLRFSAIPPTFLVAESECSVGTVLSIVEKAMQTQDDHISVNTNATQLVDYARVQTLSAERLKPSVLADDFPTDMFPGYTVVANVSQGGQGTIYEAIENTTKRRVAIKVLRSGSFSGTSERVRFEREVQVLGSLHHPHIVAIHTSGTAERQRYFVMDFVEGQSLDEFVRDENPSIADTLTLFLKIAGAINAAHLHGITHRDLKPSNIIIDLHGQPRVLDFGLAKTNDEQGSSVQVTTAGQFVGSLPWAAPEQLQNATDDVDLRTDVYGLGLVLYFMLTQTLPYDRFGLTRDVMDCILEGEHAAPSRDRREIDNELDTIVLKCLQVEPERRYQMAGEVARDIERYLAGEPIEAKRDSSTYLIRKTIRRHRTVAILIGAFLLTGAAYAATVSILYQQTVLSERIAQQRTEVAQDQYTLARESLAFLVNDVLEQMDDIPGTSHAKRNLLRGAYARLLPLANEHGDDPIFRMNLVHTHHQLGSLAVRLSQYDEAQLHFEEEMRLRNELPDDDAQLPENRSAFAINHVVLGDLAQRRGQLEVCLHHYQEALDIDERLVDQNPQDSNLRDNLGWSYDRLGALAFKMQKPVVAQEYYQKRLKLATELAADEPQNGVRLKGLASSYARLADFSANARDWEKAASNLLESVAVLRRVLLLEPADFDAMGLQASNLCTLSYFRLIFDPSASTADILLEAETLTDSLVELEKELPGSHWLHAKVCFQVMENSLNQGDGELTLEYATKTLAAVDEFEQRSPSNEDAVYVRARTLKNMAQVHQNGGEMESAEEHFEQAVATLEQAFGNSIDSAKLRMLHLNLVSPLERITSQRAAAIHESAEVLLKLPGGDEPDALVAAGMAYDQIGENAMAVATLQRAKDASAFKEREFPEVAHRTLKRLLSTIDQP